MSNEGMDVDRMYRVHNNALTCRMEKERLVAIKTYVFIIQLVCQVILLHLIFVYMCSVGMIRKSQRMVVIALVLLDESVRLADFDTNYGKDVITAALFKEEAAEVRGEEVNSHCKDTNFLAVLDGASATTDFIFTFFK